MRKGSTGSSTICRSGHEELLVLAPNWLGDAVMATPFLFALRERFPAAAITLFSREYPAELYRRSPAIDSLAEYRGDMLARLAAVRRIRPAYGFDACFVLPPSVSAAVTSVFSNARRRIGYGDRWRRACLTDAVPAGLHRDGHLSRSYMRLLERFAGCAVPDLPLPSVTPETIWPERVEAIVGRREYFVLAPGAAYGAAKAWPGERYGALARMLVNRTGWTAVVVGQQEDHGLACEIIDGVGALGKNLAGELSLADLISVLRGARLAIGNDSGPVHIAAALGVATVAVFGPTSVDWTSPRGIAVRIIKSEIDCAPCFKRECPRGAPECLVGVEAERVFDAATSLIEEGKL
ncbi:MAG: lipopolysaccharide heptosyltransferase II [Candidatus Krumholzibacteria bacterium]|nr:lipopolysaccharide heptosyltransferase II [Candidatus Krumholzibacteria bacterium]